MTDIEKLQETYTAAGITLTPAHLTIANESFDKLAELHVTGIEAVKAVINKLSRAGVEKPAMAPATSTKIGFVNKKDAWYNITGKTVQLWDPNHENILQTGLIGDETGIVKFTIWKTANPEVTMEEGKVYTLKNVVNNPWGGQNQVSANRTSKITLESIDITVKSNEVTVEGFALVLQAGSGLIKRCPECNKALNKGICHTHGKVVGTYDIRMKLVIDDGRTAHECILDTNLTEQFTGMSLEQAKALATQELSADAVADEMAKTIGKYVKVTGSQMQSRYIIAESIEPITENPSVTDIRKALAQVA